MKIMILGLAVLAIVGGTGSAHAESDYGSDYVMMKDVSAWFDVSYKPGRKEAPTPRTDLPEQNWAATPKTTMGICLQPFKYGGIRAWFGEGTSDYSGDSISDGLNDGFAPSGGNAPGGVSIGRKTYGPKFGFDFLGFLPATDRLSLFAGPGAYTETSAEFIVNTRVWGPDHAVIDDSHMLNKKTQTKFAGSGGFIYRIGAEHFLRDLAITGGYHSERGITAGLGFKW